MSIKLRCPQGHLVVCPDNKVGQSGKCPKCGSKFTVPDASTPAGDAPAEDAPTEDLIVFLCPNGHKLNGPANLQGRPGQCPHCHAKFVIPDYNEAEDQQEETAHDEVESTTDTTRARNEYSRGGQDVESGQSGDPDHAESLDELSVGPHPMAAMLRRLWRERRDGVVAEVRLKDGSIFVPEQYGEAASQQDHGVFAVKEADGSFTLNVVAWDSVAQISLRRMRRLPPEMFG